MGMSEDDIPTRQIQRLNWLPPVRRVEDLPARGVPEGALCFVEGSAGEGEEEVWEYREGAWHRFDTL